MEKYQDECQRHEHDVGKTQARPGGYLLETVEGETADHESARDRSHHERKNQAG